jgi:carbon-monoxide dehydrogenase large subunit
MMGGPYRWRAGGRCRSVATTTTPVGAFRGAGRPEATAAIERAIDLAARRAGADPLELRLRNLVEHDAFPYTSPTGMVYDSGDYARCVREAAQRIGYDDVRARQRDAGAHAVRRQGVAVVAWLDCTPMNRPGEYASLRLGPSPEAPGFVVEVRDGANDQGQSHQTTWALVLSERLRIPPSAVRLHGGDTAEVPQGEGTGSARSAQLAGNAVAGAAALLLDEARAVAADLLEAATADIVLDGVGRFAVRGAPSRSVGWADIAASSALEQGFDFEQPGPTFPSGAHAAVVEVDVETGAVELLRFVAVDDCGTVINPVAVEGQQHGGIAQGVGQALLEHVQHDADGTPRTTTFTDYLVPSASELCAIDATTIDLASPINPIGAKGIGQAGAIGATAAVQNAVLDALASLGVEHIDLPLTPERVWQAVSRQPSETEETGEHE